MKLKTTAIGGCIARPLDSIRLVLVQHHVEFDHDDFLMLQFIVVFLALGALTLVAVAIGIVVPIIMLSLGRPPGRFAGLITITSIFGLACTSLWFFMCALQAVGDPSGRALAPDVGASKYTYAQYAFQAGIAWLFALGGYRLTRRWRRQGTGTDCVELADND